MFVRRAIRAVVLAMCVSTLNTSAMAQVKRLKAGNGMIAVYKDSKSMSEAIQLISADVHKTNPQLVAPLISCIVKDGTSYIVSNGGFFSSDIMIVDGPDAGCRGTVPNERLDSAR